MKHSNEVNFFTKAKTAAQLASQAKVGNYEDHVSLDVHSINELKDKGVKPTDDSSKYDYSATSVDPDADYKFPECQGTVIAIRRNKQFVDKVLFRAKWFDILCG